LVLIDDGSTDSSGAICDRYAKMDSRIRVFHKPNGGVSSARNIGVDNAKGQWITFIDADDWIEPSMLKELLAVALDNNADYVYCDQLFDYGKHQKYNRAATFASEHSIILKNFIKSIWTVIWSSLVKAEIYKKHNLRFSQNYTYCEDFLFAVKSMFYAQKIAYVPKAYYHYNQLNSTSCMQNLNPTKMRHEQSAYMDAIAFFKEQKVYETYAQEMGWRILKSKQEWVLNIDTHKEFMRLHPDSHKYIWSCPYINKKLKIMMWCLTHHLPWVTFTMIYARNFKEYLIHR
jgi:glycosyltransferase involved in cell wall biosynthesis